MDAIYSPWPWWVAGPLIGLFVPVMVMLGARLGISSNLKHLCQIMLPSKKVAYLNYALKPSYWSLFFFGGLFLGGLVGQFALSESPVVMLAPSAATPTGVAGLFVGGLLIGFGTRYAEGCTSGHSISGLSNLQLASLVASVCFFAGGLTMRAIDLGLGGLF